MINSNAFGWKAFQKRKKVLDIITLVLGLEVFINIGHVGHDLLPVRPLDGNHFRQVQAGRDPDRFCGLKCDREIASFLTCF